ncbi:MAG: hypothetical protein AVDCRST_MAG68-1191 [uncultured Gemmatimonadetes bacterium]|uniref:Uncharacterized protein n=1 Tax=uncultured Gemmatimonadota bacterium TaxID=203437 RepID=A0A6J4KQG9_9BACT|nr:MAG: hypothetical protein AVDCRST_MAG68-1191 [uncultured Gemmatimonadota bacterium]
MPAYSIDFATETGPRRLRFTLDTDRPLGAQVQQIVEEMRQHDVVLSGGPGDELAVTWNGIDLQLDRSPGALGVTPDRALELRMRPRVAPAAAPYFPRSAYAAPVAGVTGALAGWVAASALTDLGPWLASYRALDVAAGALLGAGTGLGVRAGAALRRGARVWLAGASGLLVGAAGGGVGTMLGIWLGVVADPGYLVLRVMAWVAVAAGIGAALGMAEAGARRGVDGAVYGISAGAAGAFLFSLPGPAEFWQALAFAVVGAALGSGLHTPALRRAHAVLGSEAERGWMTLFGIREWVLEDGGSAPLFGTRGGSPAAVVRCDSGQCQVVLAGGAAVRVGGLPLQGARPLRDADVVELDGNSLRFREIRA